MFKESNKTFLFIGFLIIIVLVWQLMEQLDMSFNFSSEEEERRWLEEMGVSLVDVSEQELWPEGAPAKFEWASYMADCLSSSDDLSLARCQYILDQINSFNDCVLAGFPVTGSNPEHCQTIDGNNFFNY